MMQTYRFEPSTEGLRPPARPRVPARTGIPQLVSRAVAALVAGSGLLTLARLMGTTSPTHQPANQWTWIRDLLPLEAGSQIASVELLFGFALVLTSLHLWARKRRALHLAIGLAAVSSCVSFLHGHAWQGGASSAVAVLLILSRRFYRLGSGPPALALALRRAAVAVAVALTYGTAGFWLLDARHFGRNFHWWDAAARTLRAMLLLGDAGLDPRTPHAAWFLMSLFLLSASTFLYCGFTLFRPVAYRFRQGPSEAERARQIALHHGRSGQDYFKLAGDKSLFFSRSGATFLAYRVARNFALVLGDPVGPEGEIRATMEQFIEYCVQRGWRVGFHQVEAARVPLYRELGFRSMKIGADALVNLERFTLAGSAMKEFRNTVNRLTKLGFRVERVEPPIDRALLEELRGISDEWLALPGHRERRFTLGSFSAAYVASTTIYVAFDVHGRAIAFLNLVPSYQPDLATVDLMRRRGGAVNGLMDFLFAMTFLDLKARGYRYFSLGMAPDGERSREAQSNAEERVVHWALRRARGVFRGDSLRRFKAKYADSWEPRYEIYQSRWDLPRLALALLSVTETPRKLRHVS